MAFDTFDTDALATAGGTFSGGNLVVTGGGNPPSLAQTLEGKTAGKWYVEFTCTTVGGGGGCGVMNSQGAVQFVGSNANGWSYNPTGSVFNNNSSQGGVNASTYTTGDVVGVAIDLDNSRLWFNKNGSANWRGTAGTPNPATNTGGFDISGLLANSCRVFPIVDLAGSSQKWTANFGATAFTGTVPSGFTSGWTNTTSGTVFGSMAACGSGVLTFWPTTTGGANTILSKWVCGVTGTLATLIFPFSGASTNDLKALVYSDSSGPANLLAASAAVSSGGGGAIGELSFTVSLAVTSGTTYWIGLATDQPSTSNRIIIIPGTGASQFNANSWSSPPSTFGASSAANDRFPMLAVLAAAPASILLGQAWM